jgi:hypothetical protein
MPKRKKALLEGRHKAYIGKLRAEGVLEEQVMQAIDELEAEGRIVRTGEIRNGKPVYVAVWNPTRVN